MQPPRKLGHSSRCRAAPPGWRLRGLRRSGWPPAAAARAALTPLAAGFYAPKGKLGLRTSGARRRSRMPRASKARPTRGFAFERRCRATDGRRSCTRVSTYAVKRASRTRCRRSRRGARDHRARLAHQLGAVHGDDVSPRREPLRTLRTQYSSDAQQTTFGAPLRVSTTVQEPAIVLVSFGHPLLFATSVWRTSPAETVASTLGLLGDKFRGLGAMAPGPIGAEAQSVRLAASDR